MSLNLFNCFYTSSNHSSDHHNGVRGCSPSYGGRLLSVTASIFLYLSSFNIIQQARDTDASHVLGPNSALRSGLLPFLAIF